MARKKGFKYTEDLGRKFLSLCKQGKSLTQIADATGIPKQKWRQWYEDPRNFSFHKFWESGREACQAYHENLLDTMIKEGASGPVIEAQKYVLRVRFKEDWSEKQESKIEVSHVNNLSDQELQAQIDRMLVKPHLRKLYVAVDNTSQKDIDDQEKEAID